MSSNRKLDFRWLGPYQIKHANTEKGYYKLKELGPNGAMLGGTYARNRLKLFHARDDFFFSTEDRVSEASSLSSEEVENDTSDTSNIIKVQLPSLFK